MAGTIITLYLDDTNVRLLVAKGRRIKKMAELPLELGTTKVKSNLKEAEVITKIKQLLRTKKVGAKKVIVGISGLHCLTRPFMLPQLPKAMLAEGVMREAKRVLPVPLDQLYISWQTIPGPAGKTQGFLVAIPRQVADNIIKILHEAGLKPYIMDLKPLALARVIKEANAVMLDVQQTEFDIVIMTNGVPQPVRTVPFPADNLSLVEKLELVKDELVRTSQFYESKNPDNPLGPNLPLYIFGELAGEPEQAKALASQLGFVLAQQPAPLKYPKELDPTRFMVNIGLALKEIPGKDAGPSVANLNALPAPYLPKPVPIGRLVTIPATAVAIGAVALMTNFVYDASGNIATARDQLDSTNQIIQVKQTQKKDLTTSIADMEKKVATMKASRDTFLTLQDSLDRQGSVINGDLAATTSNLITSTLLNLISHNGGKLTLQGAAASEEEVLLYASNLEKTGRFAKIIISHLRQESENTTMQFTIVMDTGNVKN